MNNAIGDTSIAALKMNKSNRTNVVTPATIFEISGISDRLIETIQGNLSGLDALLPYGQCSDLISLDIAQTDQVSPARRFAPIRADR